MCKGTQYKPLPSQGDFVMGIFLGHNAFYSNCIMSPELNSVNMGSVPSYSWEVSLVIPWEVSLVIPYSLGSLPSYSLVIPSCGAFGIYHYSRNDRPACGGKKHAVDYASRTVAVNSSHGTQYLPDSVFSTSPADSSVFTSLKTFL